MDADEAIAIVGVACNFPGAPDLDAYWRILVNGENHVKEIPNDRWNNEAFFNTDKNEPGKSYVKHAAFIERFKEWDNKFFGINDEEAKRMDPQQHLLLECVYRAMENGGFPIDRVTGSNIGCFIGLMNEDYAAVANSDLKDTTNYTVTGNSKCIAANRISYTFNFTGPSLIFDTACSSSLVALHFACQSLKSGDCSMAVCGGVNFMISPDMFVILSRARMLSPDGQCKPFSNEGNGYARGEGCGIVVLKPLKQAIVDRDNIWAIVGTGCNQDGHSATPITAPSSLQQEALLQSIYGKYKLDPSYVSYIEAHGTGTKVGDPAEASSLGRVIGNARAKSQPSCLIGSVKGNIGHLESAAGIAGLIKVLLMMKYKMIVPSILCDCPNDDINFAELQLQIAREAKPWISNANGSHYAAVNSFGFGGTNAHCIVKNYVPTRWKDVNSNEVNDYIIAISAESIYSFENTILDMMDYLAKHKDIPLMDLSCTSMIRRSHFTHRLAFRVSCVDDLLTKLKESASAKQQEVNIAEKRLITFIFCGMGTSWDGMGSQLMQSEPVFKEAMEKVDELLASHTGWSIISKMQEKGMSSRGMISQLALFTLQVSLAELWKSFGVVPDCIIGHSVGEVAAAQVAGKLSLADAVRVIYHRAKLLEKVRGGKMLVLSRLSLNEVKTLCNLTPGKVEIAAINSDTSFTLSGDSDSILIIHEHVKAKYGNVVFNRILNVETAYHSYCVEPVLEEFRTLLNFLHMRKSSQEVQIYSTVTGKLASEFDFVTADYWCRNLRHCVHFSDAVKSALRPIDHNVIVEVGPKPALRTNINELSKGMTKTTLYSMKENDARNTMLDSVCRLYEIGSHVDWKGIIGRQKGRPLDIPRYQFNKREHFYEPNKSKKYRMGLEETTGSTYQFVARAPTSDIVYTVVISRATMAFVYDHRISGSTVVPGATYIDLALEAFLSHAPHIHVSLCKVGVEFINPVVLQAAKREIAVHLHEIEKNKTYEFKIISSDTRHAEGYINIQKHDGLRRVDLDHLSLRCNREIEVKKLYHFLNVYGFSYGPLLRTLSAIWRNDTESLSVMSVPEDIVNQISTTVIHPAILDGMMQSIGIPILSDDEKYRPCFPVSIGSIAIYRQLPQRIFFFVEMINREDYLARFNALVLDDCGEVIAECEDIVAKFLEDGESRVINTLAYEMQWRSFDKAESMNPSQSPPKRCIIFADSCGVSSAIKPLVSVGSVFITVPETKICSLPDLEKYIKANCTSFDPNAFEHCLYFWGIVDNVEQHNPESVYEHICRSSTSLIYLIQFLTSLQAKLPISVITLGSQVLKDSVLDNRQMSCGLVGMPLWGLIRSCLREGTYNRIKMINLTTGTNEELESMTENLLQDTIDEEPEWWFQQKKMYTNNICRVHPHRDYFRKRRNVAESGMSIKVLSRHPTKIQNIHLMPAETRAGSNKSSFTNVRIKEVRLHQSDLFPVTFEEMTLQYSSCWPERSDGYDVIGIDFLGIVQEGELHSKMGKSYEVQICYPTKVQSTIQVPDAVVVKCDLLPPWLKQKPVLSYLVLCWEILMNKVKCRPGYKIAHLVDERMAKFNDLLVTITKMCGFFSKKLDKAHIQHYDLKDVDVLINMSELSSAVVSQLVEGAPPDMVFVSLRKNGITQSTATILPCGLEFQRPDIKVIVIDPPLILRPSHLQICLPQVCSWLKQLPPSFATGSCPIQLVSINELHEHAVEYDNMEAIPVLKMNTPGPIYPRKEDLFRSDACYLIIGGTRGLGLVLMKYMAEKGAGFLAVFSRKPPQEKHKIYFQDLERIGTKLIFLQGDISVRADVKSALKKLRAQLKDIPLKGVFHGAVTLEDCLLLKMNEEKYKLPTKPKIMGALNLHEETKKDPLDYFVMHSSVTSAFGNIGQSNYASGNAFLDFFAHLRRSKGMCAQSLNWGLLGLGLMENQKKLEEMLKSLGFIALNAQDIVACFEYALIHNPVQIILGDFNWSVISQYLYTESFKHVRGRFKELVLDMYTETKKSEQILGPVEEVSDIQMYTKNLVSDVLALDTGKFPDDAILNRLGLNSMSAMLLQTHIREEVGVEIPMVLLVDSNTSVSSLAAYIEENDPITNSMAQPLVTSSNQLDQKNMSELTGGENIEDIGTNIGDANSNHLPSDVFEVNTNNRRTIAIYEYLNNTTSDYAISKCAHQMFEEIVQTKYEVTALNCQGQSITYGDISVKATIIASAIIHYCNKKGSHQQNIGIYSEDPIGYIASVIAIWKAGHAVHLLETGNSHVYNNMPDIIITNQLNAKHFKNRKGKHIINYDALPSDRQTSTLMPLPDAPAFYINQDGGNDIHAEGSHSSIINRLAWLWSTYPYEKNEEILAAFHPASPDFLVMILAGILQTVPITIVSSSESRLNKEEIAKNICQTITNNKATRICHLGQDEWEEINRYLQSTSNIFQKNIIDKCVRYIYVNPRDIRIAIVSSIRNSFPSARIVNMFVDPAVIGIGLFADYPPFNNNLPPNVINVGIPIANSKAFILCDDNSLANEDEWGRLCLGSMRDSDIPLEKRMIYQDQILYDTGRYASLTPTGEFLLQENNSGMLPNTQRDMAANTRLEGKFEGLFNNGIYLEKSTRFGWTHQKKVRLTDNANITWTSNGEQKRLNLHDVSNIKTRVVNGCDVLEFHTKQRLYCFTSKEKNVVPALVEVLSKTRLDNKQ